MVMDLVEDVVGSQQLMEQLVILLVFCDWIVDSWCWCELYLYGWFDFVYDGIGLVKFYEFNYDILILLFEVLFFQW